MERTFGYIGARRVSEIGPHIFASNAPEAEGDRSTSLRKVS
jgi:hypothetical protein